MHYEAGMVAIDTISTLLIKNIRREVLSLFYRWQSRALKGQHNSSKALEWAEQTWDLYPRLGRIWLQTWAAYLPLFSMNTLWACFPAWIWERVLQSLPPCVKFSPTTPLLWEGPWPAAKIHALSPHNDGLHLRSADLVYSPTHTYPVHPVWRALNGQGSCLISFSYFTALSIKNVYAPSLAPPPPCCLLANMFPKAGGLFN